MADTDPTTVLADPLAVELMSSAIPARFAYTGFDGAPRVVPVGFHWNGRRFVVGTHPATPKVRALLARPEVAMTIDTNVLPQRVLLVRGTAQVEPAAGAFSEYVEAGRKLVPAETFADWETSVRSLYQEMTRITITPTWAKLMDFETRGPAFLEEHFAER